MGLNSDSLFRIRTENRHNFVLILVRVPRDPFFDEGDRLSKINEPVVLTSEDVEEFLHRSDNRSAVGTSVPDQCFGSA